MISYCIACYRPVYTQLLIDDLYCKTDVDYEILLWLNCDDEVFERFLAERISAGYPVQIVGKTVENIGMRAYFELFQRARYELVTQIDDDVICVSPGIAQTANRIFQRHKRVRQLVADVWQDEYTTGARPEMSHYRSYDQRDGLYEGPIDGWFSICHRSALACLPPRPAAGYFPLGTMVKQQLRRRGLRGLLCTGLKVFHVIGPQYSSRFGMLDFEIEKYQRLGRTDIVSWYQDAKAQLPDKSELEDRVNRIYAHLAVPVTV